jgi:hypothetical protein
MDQQRFANHQGCGYARPVDPTPAIDGNVAVVAQNEVLIPAQLYRLTIPTPRSNPGGVGVVDVAIDPHF